MANLWRCESTNGNPRQGGFVVEFAPGVRKVIEWDRGAPVVDTLAIAKMLAARLIDDLLQEGAQGEVNATNWASMTAAIQRIVIDWNDELKASLYAQGNAPTLQ